MGWRYKAGLFLIGTVVVIWVTSAEVTQVHTSIDSRSLILFEAAGALICVPLGLDL